MFLLNSISWKTCVSKNTSRAGVGDCPCCFLSCFEFSFSKDVYQNRKHVGVDDSLNLEMNRKSFVPLRTTVEILKTIFTWIQNKYIGNPNNEHSNYRTIWLTNYWKFSVQATVWIANKKFVIQAITHTTRITKHSRNGQLGTIWIPN